MPSVPESLPDSVLDEIATVLEEEAEQLKAIRQAKNPVEFAPRSAEERKSRRAT